MNGELSFATLDYAGKKKRTKRDVFGGVVGSNWMGLDQFNLSVFDAVDGSSTGT